MCVQQALQRSRANDGRGQLRAPSARNAADGYEVAPLGVSIAPLEEIRLRAVRRAALARCKFPRG